MVLVVVLVEVLEVEVVQEQVVGLEVELVEAVVSVEEAVSAGAVV
jgi:hypothetical protein